MQDDKVEINRRFFQAIDELVERRVLKSAAAFCRQNAYASSNLARLKSEPHREFPLHLLASLVKDYGVSGDWILTGTSNRRR